MRDFAKPRRFSGVRPALCGLAASAAIGLVGCGGEVATGTPDAGTPPVPDPIGADLTLIEQALSSAPPYWATALPSGDVLLAFQDRIERASTATTTRWSAPAGRIVGAGTWSGGTLLAASDGFYVLGDGELMPSPLTDALMDMEPVGLVAVDRRGVRELWVAGRSGLAVWSGGRVQRLVPGDLPAQDCALAFGAPQAGARALWVACEGRLYALVGEDQTYQAHELVDVSDVRAIAVDGADTLWIVDGAGAVFSRATSGLVRAHDFASDVRAVAAGADDVWFETDRGLWRFDQSTFQPVSSPSGTLLAAAGAGQVLVSTPSGLVRGHAQRVVRLSGLAPDALLESPATITAHPLEPAKVTELRATLDAAEIPVGSGWSVSLDPAALEDGSHELVVTAVYADGEQVQSLLRFSRYAGPPPTWAGDVQPLFETRCALCHGAQGAARRLDGIEIWKDQIDIILDNLRTGRMPLPPTPLLDDEELGRIEGWVAAGYPEGE